MGGITSGIGIFSGIDSGSIIQQLLQIEARPRNQAAARVVQLQFQQTAYLDINSRLSGLRDAAKLFRDRKTFQTKSATSSDADILSGIAGTSAAAGSYQFVVDRLVTTQQLLSRGFANKDNGAVGATSFTFESTQARLDRDVSLADLNNGSGVARGRFTITDSGGQSATIDLSRAISVSEVLDAINTNGTARVTASVEGGKFVLKDTAAGAGAMTVANAAGYTTAASLGIAGTAVAGTITGGAVYQVHGNTTLAALNDGNGVSIKTSTGTDSFSFMVTVTGTGGPVNVRVNIGDVYQDVVPPGGGPTVLTKTQGAVTTVQGVLDRTNAALAAAGVTGVTAAIDPANGRFAINETSGTQTVTIAENGDTTAADLGLLVPPTGGSIQGRRVFAGLNTTLGRGLNGGFGIYGDGNLNFTLHDGSVFTAAIDTTASLTDIFRQIETASALAGVPRVRAALDTNGTGIVLTDQTTGASQFQVEGSTGDDTAEALGVNQGTTGATISSGNLQRQYIGRATLLSSLNNGRGVGTGSFRITDSDNTSAVVTLSENIKTVGDFINFINSRPLRVQARINGTGDGIEIYENTSVTPAGGARIRIEDTSGSVARSLNLSGTATGTGAANKLDGTYERTVAFNAADTLQQVTDKINQANIGAAAAIVRDGNGSTPFRLSLSSGNSGTSGRFIINTGALDLGLQTLESGRDSLAFYGSTDPARGIAITSSSNTVDSILPGVTIDLRGASATPVTLTVARDTAAIETAITAFITAFNTTIDRIDSQSSYDKETERSAPLQGDGTVRELRSALFRTVQSAGIGTTGRFDNLADIGITVTAGGNLELDEERLRDALQEDAASVESLFITREAVDDAVIDLYGDGSVLIRNPNAGSTFSSLGVMGQFEELTNRYIDSVTGVLTGRSKGIDDQIKLQNERIAAFDARLEQRRGILQNQFLAMEQAIGRLQGQQGALSSISQLG